MNWLADIVKNLTVSKILVTAVFITATTMYFGPIVAPESVPKTPSDLVSYVFALMVLTGCILLLWGLSVIWSVMKDGARGFSHVLTNQTLSSQEIGLLLFMAKDPSRAIDLERLDYQRIGGTKLEYHQLTKQLEIKGLARIYNWDDNLISLTERGRVRALELQKQLNNS